MLSTFFYTISLNPQITILHHNNIILVNGDELKMQLKLSAQLNLKYLLHSHQNFHRWIIMGDIEEHCSAPSFRTSAHTFLVAGTVGYWWLTTESFHSWAPLPNLFLDSLFCQGESTKACPASLNTCPLWRTIPCPEFPMIVWAPWSGCTADLLLPLPNLAFLALL